MTAPLLIPDISHYSHIASNGFHLMMAAGYPCVIMKATEGVTYDDPAFADLFIRARMTSVIPGAYAFIDPKPSGIAQEQHFLKVAHLRKGDLQPIVDAEAVGLTRATVLQALYTLEKQGYKPILYTYKSFWEGLGSPKRWPVWIASYTPQMPDLGKDVEIFAWQYTDRANVNGVLNPCDCSKFFGNIADLRKYVIS